MNIRSQFTAQLAAFYLQANGQIAIAWDGQSVGSIDAGRIAQDLGRASTNERVDALIDDMMAMLPMEARQYVARAPLTTWLALLHRDHVR